MSMDGEATEGDAILIYSISMMCLDICDLDESTCISAERVSSKPSSLIPLRLQHCSDWLDQPQFADYSIAFLQTA